MINASGFSARAIGLEGFRFGGGPVRRYVGQPVAGDIFGLNVVPGGPSGDPADPDYATQLAIWLTGEQHPVNMEPFALGEKEELVPAP